MMLHNIVTSFGERILELTVCQSMLNMKGPIQRAISSKEDNIQTNVKSDRK